MEHRQEMVVQMTIPFLLEYNERGQLRAWLEEHAATETCCWVAVSRSKKPLEADGKPVEAPYLSYLDVVEEALCFGWIDSTLQRLPDGRLAQRLSPRRKHSHWTELNRQRCADLERRGLITDLGRKALERETTWHMQN